MIKNSLKRIGQFLMRKIFFSNDIKLFPLSRKFGYDRGTPIDRIYIKNYLCKYSHLFNGECLEIGFPEYLLEFSTPIDKINVIGVNKKNRKFKFINCDLTDSKSLPNKKFNLFICTQTYNFIENYSAAIENSARLISENGALLGTVSGLSTLSKYDDDRWGDYYRFSPNAIRKILLNYFNHVEVTSYGNLYSAIHYLAGFSYEDLESPHLLTESDELFPVIIGFMASSPKI